jgi:tetrahydromethanopterin S-methyltransferase subunit C
MVVSVVGSVVGMVVGAVVGMVVGAVVGAVVGRVVGSLVLLFPLLLQPAIKPRDSTRTNAIAIIFFMECLLCCLGFHNYYPLEVLNYTGNYRNFFANAN